LQCAAVAFERTHELVDSGKLPVCHFEQRASGLDRDDRGAVGLHVRYLLGCLVYHTPNNDWGQ
jgi:hypothetical protein